jgi:hypothetical protein
MRYLPEGRGRGSRTWMVEVLSLMSRRMSRTPYGAYLRASGVMMFVCHASEQDESAKNDG